MYPLYQFKLDDNIVHPIYNSDLTLDYSQESSQKFYRKELSGKLTFQNEDYEYIMSQDFEAEIIFSIETYIDKAWQVLFKGSFFRTDCTIDYDNKKIEVKPSVKDQYIDTLAGINNEYDLVKLKPVIENISLCKRPMVQVYIPGESVVSCFFGHLFWEQDCTEVEDDGELKAKYGFAHNKTIAYVELEASSSSAVDMAGVYVLSDSNIGSIISSTLVGPNGYKLSRQLIATLGYYSYTLKDSSDNVIGRNSEARPDVIWSAEISELPLLLVGTQISVAVYMRLLSDVQTISGVQGIDLPPDDLVGNNRNYKYAIPYDRADNIAMSYDLSEEPTEWGIYQPGQYYMPPNSIYDDNYYPIARTKWSELSFWFATDFIDDIFEAQGRKQYKIRDTYPLASAISVLLKEIAPDIKHEETAEYSQFLYGNQQIGQKIRLMICQKTNLINGEYTQPAQKATIKLSEIFTMLANAFQCYWFIEDNKLKIEHIRFFKNGGSYGANTIGIDLTKLFVPSNKKAWSYKTSKVTYEKESMAERYEFSQMDEVTLPFSGWPIEIISKYTEKGKIEDISISPFSTDVDYMLLNPSAISSDGFAMFGVTGSDNKVPIVQLELDGEQYKLQNGYLALSYLIDTYWVFDLPTRVCKINNVQRSTRGISKQKKQELNCPIPIDINPAKLIHTELGDGQVEKLSINITTLMAKINLRYDTDS